ncbi:MAG: phosphatase PAP2 family protein [Thermodesulfovibrio sp.]|nr:phosphatase PAP2 family protein [Thermodesulfovibrio sp.]
MSLSELDTSLFFIINKGLQNSLFDSLMPFITKRGLLFCLPFLIWAGVKERRNIIPYILLSAIAVGIADGSGNILKHAFERVRPCHALEGVNLLVGCGKAFSLPSNHAANGFAFALTFWPLRRKVLTYGCVSLAAAVAFSRVYIGVHYPGDVIAGAAVGAAAAALALFLYRWLMKIYPGKCYHSKGSNPDAEERY